MVILSTWERYLIVVLLGAISVGGDMYVRLGGAMGAVLFYVLYRVLIYHALPRLWKRAPLSVPKIPGPDWGSLGRKYQRFRQ